MKTLSQFWNKNYSCVECVQRYPQANISPRTYGNNIHNKEIVNLI